MIRKALLLPQRLELKTSMIEPENTFWNPATNGGNNPVAGNYTICVDSYEIPLPVLYTVIVRRGTTIVSSVTKNMTKYTSARKGGLPSPLCHPLGVAASTGDVGEFALAYLL
jgi:hypothetical protein